MRSNLGLLLVFFSAASAGQTITPARLTALNNYVEYANHSCLEVEALFNKIVSYYPEIARAQTGKFNVRPFACGEPLDDYYFNQAISKSISLSNSGVLNVKANGLREIALNLDQKCKALDTYYKLKDYEQDKYKRAYDLINDMHVILVDYRKSRDALASELESTYRKLQPVVPGNPYHTADLMMKTEIGRERAFLESWSFNLNEEIHTGWPVDKLRSSILETDQAVNRISQAKLSVAYPASSMIGSFTEALGLILDSKRTALDGYNFEAKKSDEHSNRAYLNLINYFNGTLVSDQNMFVQFASADGFSGLKAMRFVPYFEIRSNAEVVDTEVKPFQDISHAALKISSQPTPVPNPVFHALSTYVDFINESLNQISYLHNVLRNYNSSARYYKDLTSYKGRGGLTYDHARFQIPLSIYQTLVVQSASLPAAYRKSLTDQAEVLLNILTEMDQLSIALTVDARERRYEKDNLKRAYEILDRNAVLFGVVDTKKEQLYRDVRAVYEAYATPNPTGSWAVSNKALLTLVDEDKEQLFKARDFFRGDSSSVPSAALVDRYLREVIANEYANMKGIERYGRSNGLCPYSPYEDVPQNSRTFSEKIIGIKTRKSSSTDGPYHDFVYLFNVIVDDYNKFCELAKADLLKTIREPELFYVRPAKQESPAAVLGAAGVAGQGENRASGIKTVADATHDTVKTKDVPVTTRVLDTVYIEKHDTIYMGAPGENLMSMEGYATNNLVFLLDVSGSMNAGQKLPLLKQSMVVLLNMLRPEDQVSVVIYSGKARVALPPTSAQEGDKIRKVIENLQSDGDTDGNAGIKLAYKVADGNYIRAGNNRIVLATDGEFPISDDTFALASKFSNQDIFLSVFNFGRSPVQNLEKLADVGKGHYEYITKSNSDSKLIREAKGKRRR